MFMCYSDKNNVKNLCDTFLRFIKMPFVFAVNLLLFILVNLIVTFFIPSLVKMLRPDVIDRSLQASEFD